MSDSKLSFDDQIKWLKHHKVDVENEVEAQNYLKYTSYFYKMISFVKVFNNEGQCIDSFDMLIDVSTLDMELRYCLLNVNTDLKLSEITGLKMYFFTGLNAALHVVPCNLSYDMICQKF